MGNRSVFYQALGEEPKEEKKEQATGTRAVFYNALADNDEQTPATASASGYNSLALPTPDEWANRYMGELGANLRLNPTQQKTQPAQTRPTKTQPAQAQPVKTAGASMALPTPEEWANRAQGELAAALRTVPGGSVTVQPAQKTTTVQTGKGKAEPGAAGGGGRGRTTEAEAKADARAARMEAAAFQPTSDMYLNPRTAEAAKTMQDTADVARARAAEKTAVAEALKPEVEKQREKVEKAQRELRAIAYSNNTPEGVKAYQEKLAEFNEENQKLREMGGRYGLKEDAETVGENLVAGLAGAGRGLANAAAYAGQEITRGQLMEQQSVMSGLPGQKEIADSSGKLLEDMQQRGLQSFAQQADTLGLEGLAKADKSIQDFTRRAAEHSSASGKVTKAMAATANGVGGMIPSILVNLAAPGTGLWVMMAQAAGNATEEALEAGAQDEKAVLYGLAVGGVEALTEKITGGIPGLNVGALDDVAEGLVKKALQSGAAQKAAMLLFDALGEGFEEFISEFADYGLNRWLVKTDGRSLAEVNKDAWYAGLIGALTSLAMKLPTDAIKAMSPKELARAAADEAVERVEANQEAEDLKLPTVDTTETTEAAEGKKTAPEGTAEAGNDTATVTKKLADSLPQLSDMQPVAEVTGNEVPKTGRPTERVMEYLKSIGNKVFREGLGDVLFSKNNVKGGLIGHGISDAKIDMFAAVPSVIQQGRQIDYQPKWKGRPWDAYIFAGPVTYKGAPTYLAAVVAKDNNSNRYYLHQVVDEAGNVLFENKEAPVTAVDGRPVLSDGLRTVSSPEAPTANVTPEAQEVKSDLSLPDVETEQTATPAVPEDLRLPSPEDVAEVESWRKQEAQRAEEDRMADEEAYRAAKAEEDEEAAYARLEHEGKQMERTNPPKAPKSRATLKQRVQEIFSIQEGSKGRVNEIVDAIADDIQNGRSISEERLERLFDAIYEKGSYTREADAYFRNFRDTVKGTKIYVSPEVRAEFGEDWKALANRARRAGITFTDNINDKGPDIHAAELAEIYGMLDTQAHPAQQLEQIVDTAERGKAEVLTQEEMEDVLRGEYGNEAVQARVDEMASNFRQALEVFRQSAETEAGVRAAADAKIKKAQETASALAKKQMERKALADLQNRTLKQLQWLSKNRNRTDSEMRARFDSVLRNIDTIAVNAANEMHIDKATGKTWRDLADLYKKAKESDPNFDPKKRLEDIVMRLDGEKIGDMDYDALRDLYQAAIRLRTEYYNRNNVINDELGRAFADAYHDSVDEFKATKGYGEGKHESKASRWFNRLQLTPANYLRSLVGWKKGSTFASFGKQLENGERAYKKYVVDSAKQLEKFIKENKDWVRRADGQGKDAIWYEYEVPELVELRMGDKPIYGDTVKVYMTPAQKVHLALEAENYDNLRHMAGGRTFANKELYSKGERAEAFAKGTTIKMSPEWAKKIAADLSPEEKALKNALSKYYNEYAPGEINRVSNVLYGYDRAMSSSYAPIFTNDNYVGHQAGVTDSTAEGVGHLKSRQVSQNPSYNIGAFDAFERHADQTARFVGYSIPIRNMETLMNWRGTNNSLRDVITHTWDEESGTEYIDKLLEDLQTTKYNEAGAVQGLANKLLSNYVSSVFGFNPGIVLKQAASFPQAAAILGYTTLPTPKQLLNVDKGLIGKYTPELDYRGLGYATPETAQLKDNPGLLQRNKAMNFLFGGGAITAMDGATVQSIWPWAENYVRKNFPGLEKGTQEQIDAGESPFYKKVAEVFNEAVSTTQPMYDTMHRAKIMTSDKAIDRALTMFKTVPLQQYNTLRQAFGELQAARKSGDAAERKAAARKASNAVTATLGSVTALEAVELLNQLWKNGLKGYRDDDDELTTKSAAKKVAERAVSDLAGMTIGGSELSELIFNTINGKKWYGIEIPGGEQLNDMIDTFVSAAKTATKFVKDGHDILSNGGDLGEYYRMHGAEYADALNEAAEKFAMYFKGLPVQNVKKYLGAGLRIASPELYAQIEDSINTPNRATLKKTDEKLLPTRFQDMMERRLDMAGMFPEATSEELARLYQEYGATVAPPDVPASITVKKGDDASEKVTLDAYQTQVYEDAFRGAAKSALAGFGQDKELRGLDDDAKAAYLKRLYAVAGDYAKGEVDESYDGDYTEKIKAMQDAGIPIQSIVTTMAMKAALPDAQFAAWLDTGVYRGKTLETVKDVLNVKGTYDALKETGLDNEAIFTVTDALDELKPEEKGGSVTKWQKLDAIAGLDLSQDEIDKAASAYLTEGQMEGYRESGLGLGEYTEALRKKEATEADKDKDGEAIPGSKRMKVMELVDGMDLTDKEKDRLFQALGYEGENKWNTAYTGDDYAAYAGMTDSQRSTYMKYCDWMDAGDYARYSESIGDFHDIKNSSGKTVVTRKAQVIEYINALPLLDDQKTALYVAMGYNPNMTDKGFADCPWWNSLQMRTQYYPK